MYLVGSVCNNSKILDLSCYPVYAQACTENTGSNLHNIYSLSLVPVDSEWQSLYGNPEVASLYFLTNNYLGPRITFDYITCIDSIYLYDVTKFKKELCSLLTSTGTVILSIVVNTIKDVLTGNSFNIPLYKNRTLYKGRFGSDCYYDIGYFYTIEQLIDEFSTNFDVKVVVDDKTYLVCTRK